MALTTELIHATADELHAQGIKPTQTNVRNALGGGSFTTISEALRTWRAEQETNAQLAEVVIPAEVSERTEILTAQIWELAQSIANERLAKDREALAHKETLMNAELSEYQSVIATLESEQTELLAQLDELTAVADDLRAKLAQSEQQTADKVNELALVKQELKTAQFTTIELDNRLKDISAKYDDKADKVERLTAELATIASEKTAVVDEISKLQASYTADKATLDSTIGELQARLSQMTVDNATLTGRADTLSEQLAKAESTNQAQSSRIIELSELVAELKATHTKDKRATRN